jgi:hypothetical protein
MMDETVEAGSSTGMDRQNVIAEPFCENASADDGFGLSDFWLIFTP